MAELNEMDLLVQLAKRNLPSSAFRLILCALAHAKAGVVVTMEKQAGVTGLGEEELFEARLALREQGMLNFEENAILPPSEWGKPKTHFAIPPSAVRTSPIKKKEDYPPLFEAAWEVYPKRGPHGNPKNTAYRAWRARAQEGVSEMDLLRATKQYARFCKQQGKDNTQYVLQGATFYGPTKRYEDFLKEYEEGLTQSPDWVKKQHEDRTREEAKKPITSKKWEVRKRDKPTS